MSEEKDYVRDSVKSARGFWVGDPEYVLKEPPPGLIGREGKISLGDYEFVSAHASFNGKYNLGKQQVLIVSKNLAIIPLELCDPKMLETNAPFGRIVRAAGTALMYSHFGYFEIFLPNRTLPFMLWTGVDPENQKVGLPDKLFGIK